MVEVDSQFIIKLSRKVEDQGKDIELLKKPTTIAQINGGNLEFQLTSPHNTLPEKALKVLGQQMAKELDNLFERFKVSSIKIDL